MAEEPPFPENKILRFVKVEEKGRSLSDEEPTSIYQLPLPEKFASIDPRGLLEVLMRGAPGHAAIDEADTVIVMTARTTDEGYEAYDVFAAGPGMNNQSLNWMAQKLSLWSIGALVDVVEVWPEDSEI